MKDKTPIELPSYSEAFKRGVCEEYLSSGVSKMDLIRKYNIRFKSAIQHWLRKYRYEDIQLRARYATALGTAPVPKPKKETPLPISDSALQARIKALEQQLEDEQLRSQAYERMMEVAEKKFKILIRKKSATR